MQITIVQSEIEQAIIDHIKTQVSVKEGMAIEVTLRATRGDEGFQAAINIFPESERVPAAPAPKAAGKGAGNQQGAAPKKGGKAPAKASTTASTTAEPSASTTPSSGRAMPFLVTPETETVVSEVIPETAEVANDVDQTEAVEVVEEVAEAQDDVVIDAAQQRTNRLSIFTTKPDASEAAADEAPAAERKSIFGDLKKPVNGAA